MTSTRTSMTSTRTSRAASPSVSRTELQCPFSGVKYTSPTASRTPSPNSTRHSIPGIKISPLSYHISSSAPYISSALYPTNLDSRRPSAPTPTVPPTIPKIPLSRNRSHTFSVHPPSFKTSHTSHTPNTSTFCQNDTSSSLSVPSPFSKERSLLELTRPKTSNVPILSSSNFPSRSPHYPPAFSKSPNLSKSLPSSATSCVADPPSPADPVAPSPGMELKLKGQMIYMEEWQSIVFLGAPA